MQIHGLKSYDQAQLNLEDWFLSPLGAALLRAENAVLSEHLKQCFGVYRVHVGPGAYSTAKEVANMPRTILLGAHAGEGTQVIMDPHNLPLANDSVQALIIQHAFDIAKDPHDLLRDAARVVMPGGRMIICGFNPYSCWGLWRMIRLKQGCPWQFRFLAARRLQDWLNLLNFKVVQFDSSFYRLPINNDKWLQSADTIGAHSQRFAKHLGAVYVMSAVKQETRLRNHKPLWRAKIRRSHIGLATLDGHAQSRQNNG
ncbi:MAG: methyltransferase domain-containing protein [Gammaproteobacteria bacterium]|jgi:SAM-dependent methyltransferase|nr:methyltransferase domain-containing protein [Gammaproteobacteria bacterium]